MEALPELVTRHLEEVRALCEKYRVKRLAIFGSAVKHEMSISLSGARTSNRTSAKRSSRRNAISMPPEIANLLRDILEAGEIIQEITAGMSFTDYQQSRTTYLSVERQFITIGEALNVALRNEPR